jgi:hypothetical protein
VRRHRAKSSLPLRKVTSIRNAVVVTLLVLYAAPRRGTRDTTVRMVPAINPVRFMGRRSHPPELASPVPVTCKCDRVARACPPNA